MEVPQVESDDEYHPSDDEEDLFLDQLNLDDPIWKPDHSLVEQRSNVRRNLEMGRRVKQQRRRYTSNNNNGTQGSREQNARGRGGEEREGR